MANASEWDTLARNAGYTVNGTPTVGSIVQWDVTQSGSTLGHIAYVEEVTSTYIVISEDAYLSDTSGYSSKRRIDRSGAPFDSAEFIHIKDQVSDYRNRIVKWAGDPNPSTAWLVGLNNRRRWIRDGRQYDCLVGTGHSFAGSLDSSVLNTMPDITGKWAPCQGDVNFDRVTNILDLSILLNNYGKPTDAGSDLNGDSRVDILDLSILLTYYNRSF
jgi:hypothetical protein